MNRDRTTETLSVIVEDGRLVISVGVACLANGFDAKVVDPDTFARAMVQSLERESDEGTTMVSVMLDAAAVDAIENGAAGVCLG